MFSKKILTKKKIFQRQKNPIVKIETMKKTDNRELYDILRTKIKIYTAKKIKKTR
jgi:ERCC4-type nuclease